MEDNKKAFDANSPSIGDPFSDEPSFFLDDVIDTPSDYVSLSDVLDDELIRILAEDDAAPVSGETQEPTGNPDVPPAMTSAEIPMVEPRPITQEGRKAAPVRNSPKPAARKPVSRPAPAFYEEPEEEEDPPKRFGKKPIIALVSVLVLLSVLLVVGFQYYKKLTKDDGRILPNVYIGEMNVGGMTPEEAKSLLTETAITYKTTPMVVELGQITLTLNPADTSVSLDVKKIVDDAYNKGRTGSSLQYYREKQKALGTITRLQIFDYLTLNAEYIRSMIGTVVDSSSSVLTQPSAKLSGAIPDLDPASVEKNPEVTVKLLITLGTPGIQASTDEIYDAILSAYGAGQFQVKQDISVQNPKEVDLNALSAQFTIPAVDAKSDPKTAEIIEEVYGLGFDMQTAEALLHAAKPGQTVEIPMKYLTPTVLASALKQMEFTDTLAYEETYQYSDYNRSTNLRLACEALNGTVITPGAVFSFNSTLGERTAEKGYLPATAYVEGQYAESLGGGICQVASTLYYACLHADLEIVERYCHMYASDYVPLGMDATVYWGLLDYKFRNNTDHPIRIEAEYVNEMVCVTLKGVDDKSTYVEMEYVLLYYIHPKEVVQTFTEGNAGGHYDGEILQYPSDGCYVETYRCRYDKVTHQLISREFEDSSTYDPHDKIVVVIEKEETDPTETDPTETDPTETDPTETDPTETDPTETDPTETDPTETDPTETDPTETDPTETDPTEEPPEESSEAPTGEADT